MNQLSKKTLRRKMQYEKEYPEWCICGWGRGVYIRPQEDYGEVVGQTEPCYAKYDFYHQGKATSDNIRQCLRCGKTFVDAPAEA